MAKEPIMIDPMLPGPSITSYLCLDCVVIQIRNYSNLFLVRKRNRNMEKDKMGKCQFCELKLATHELSYQN